MTIHNADLACADRRARRGGARQRVVSDRDVLNRVEAFLSSHGIPPATFGRAAMGDPRFVFDLRAGRQLRVRTRQRVRRYLARQERAAAMR